MPSLTHDIKLAAFRRQKKLLQYLSTKDNEISLCQNLLTIENTDSDLKVHALYYANELLKNFCKLANANKRSNNKLSKIGFGHG